MLAALLVSIASAALPATGVPAAARSDDPPVKVWLNHDSYFRRGDKARVNVRLDQDGYLVVLRADVDGRVRVLFPLDPSDDAFVRGHETIEVRGRGDREAFFVDDRGGTGVVLAARSVAPFKFDEFVRGDHWDYRVLSVRDAGDDKEAALVDIVQKMIPDGHFDYDDVKYVVSASRNYYDDSYYPSYTYGGGWGWPYRYGSYYSTCYDPFFYDPFVCYDPFWFSPYRFSFSFFYGYPYFYRPYFYSPFFYRPFGFGGYAFYRQPRNLFINRGQTGIGVGGGMYFKGRPGSNVGVGGIGPRFRMPQGTFAARGRPVVGAGVSVREREAVRRDVPDREFPARDRSVEGRDVRDRGDRPLDRGSPSAREPERRDGGRGADRPPPAPERRRDPGSTSTPRSSGGGDRGMSAPRGGGGGGSRGSSSGGGSRSGGGGGSRGGGGGGSRGGGGGGGGHRGR